MVHVLRAPWHRHDGKKYEGGFLGGDIEEAVQGNREAEEYAHEFKGGMVTGFVATLLGAGGMVGGLILTGAEASQQPANTQSVPVPGLLLLAGGAVAYVAGLVVMLNAQPHLFDAINAYNDGLGGSAEGSVRAAALPAQ